MPKEFINSHLQRGESKIGCIVGIMISSILLALGLRVYPIYHSNSRFFEAVEDIASRARNMDQETIQTEIIKKAKELKISEALEPGAINVWRVITQENGMCTVRIKYARKVKLFGLPALVMTTNREIAKSIVI